MVGRVFGLVVAAAAAYWLLVITEGTYLGPRLVALLYDWAAPRYNAIKQAQAIDEQIFLGVPLGQSLEPNERPLVLDVATGTGRIPLALLRSDLFDGQIVAGDRSAGMLAEARHALGGWRGRVTIVRIDASAVPVASGSVDCVTCLEALEFMRDGRAVLREAWRALKPGGILLLTNRVGWQARFFPGRIARRGTLERECARLGFRSVQTQVWQVDYDLIWARKPMHRLGTE